MRRFIVAIILSTLSAMPVLACDSNTKATVALPIPPLAVLLDNQLPTAKLRDGELQQLKALRAEIGKLAADQKMQKARALEEEAMKILGYRKVWLRCGRGTFLWTKLASKTSS